MLLPLPNAALAASIGRIADRQGSRSEQPELAGDRAFAVVHGTSCPSRLRRDGRGADLGGASVHVTSSNLVGEDSARPLQIFLLRGAFLRSTLSETLSLRRPILRRHHISA